MDPSAEHEPCPGSANVVQAFLKRFFADQDAGQPLTLEEYQRLFPGHAEAIERSFRLACSDPVSHATDAQSRAGESTRKLERIGPYTVVERLGGGGQGEVYLCRDTRFKRRVALKVLTGIAGTWDSATLKRFEREAEVASRLEHPGICPVFEMDSDGGVPYIVMPYLEGQTLSQMIAKGRSRPSVDEPETVMLEVPEGGQAPTAHRPPESSEKRTVISRPSRRKIDTLMLIMEDSARALHAAHEAGILHRDIKPGNIIVTRDGRPVILDFGLAHDSASTVPTLTKTGQFLGTLHYMAPEQIDVKGSELDRRADIYSLGVTLYEILTLERPFDGRNWKDTCKAILEQPVRDPREHNPEIPREISAVLRVAMARQKENRYATAREFAEDLRRIRQNEPIRVATVGPLVRLRAWYSRNPALAMSLGALFLTLAGGLLATSLLLSAKARALQGERQATSRLEAERHVKELRLAELQVQTLPEEARRLWPLTRERLQGPDGMDAWVARAEALIARRPTYAAELRELRLRALPYTDAQSDRDRRRAETRDRRDRLEAIKKLQTLLESRSPETYQSQIAELREARGILESDSGKRRTWSYEDPRDLSIDTSLDAIVRGVPALKPVLREIKKRRQFAMTVHKHSIEDQQAQWADAARRVASDSRFSGVVLSPQLGLVPLGPDPSSGLEEFAHLQTGTPALRDIATGKLVITPEMGMVFVLIPPGEATIGARAPDEVHPLGSPHVDPQVRPDERLMKGITLEAFLIAKHETTQGQWSRITGANPSAENPSNTNAMGGVTLSHPVESISWADADRVLRTMALTLPTEVQWEYAARAGSTSVWWTGDEKESLKGACNLGDQSVKEANSKATWKCETWNDGFNVHSPVGAFRANDFGLHDVLGNVWEWCRDDYDRNYSLPARPGDGLRVFGGLFIYKAVRSGPYTFPAYLHRIVCRGRFAPEIRNPYVGVRPVRELQ